jgi:hypothetical protein
MRRNQSRVRLDVHLSVTPLCNFPAQIQQANIGTVAVN